MAKTMVSPLLAVLIIILPLQVIMLKKVWGKGFISRTASLVSILLILIIAGLSIPNIHQSLYSSLEIESAYRYSCPQQNVVVLGGGYSNGEEPFMDVLNCESTARLLKGVEIFQKCNSEKLILSGRGVEKKDRNGELMRDMAIQLGVDKENILLETDSANTREHPIFLEKTGWVSADADLIIVTSPWHVRRAVKEFTRVFPKVQSAASNYQSSSYLETMSGWIPQEHILSSSTTLIREHVGMLFYEILNWFDSMDDQEGR